MKNKNTLLIVVIIILSLLVIGLGSFIVYDKIINTESKLNGDKSLDNDIKNNKKYNVGDEITFNNEKWNVIKESTENDDYVVVLKATTLKELDGKPYYECPPEDDNGINCSMKYSNDYKDSLPKKYFEETYISQLGKENLKKINNYFVRLITIEELRDLGCDSNNKCDKAPSWLLSDTVSWTMSDVRVSKSEIVNEICAYAYGYDDYYETYGINELVVSNLVDVRPVINLLKSSIK